MLIGNSMRLGQNPMRMLGGVTAFNVTRSNWGQRGAYNNALMETATAKYGVPSTYRHPGAWFLPMKPGTLGSANEISGEGSLASANLAGGLNAEADLTGYGEISNAACGLILSAVAALAGVGGLSADMVGVLEASADLSGSGDLVASLGALSNMVAALTGLGSIDASMRADAYMSADITPFTELSPQSLAAAVWNAVAASYNDPDSMGRQLNEIFKIHGLDPLNPLVVNATDRTAGPDISQTIVDDAGEVTVTRT